MCSPVDPGERKKVVGGRLCDSGTVSGERPRQSQEVPS